MNDFSTVSGVGIGAGTTAARRTVDDAPAWRHAESRADTVAGGAGRESDRVDLSDQALEANSVMLNNDRPIRHDLVDRLRTEIRAGTYLTDEKLDVAAERLARAIDMQP